MRKSIPENFVAGKIFHGRRSFRAHCCCGVFFSLITIFSCLWSCGVRAETIVFQNGRRMRVEGFRVEGDQMILQISSDSEIRCEAALVAEIIDDPVSEPQEDGTGGAEKDAGGTGRPTETIPGHFDDLLQRAARLHGLDVSLLAAVVQAESAYDVRAVSPKGAMGLMQLMPATAEQYGVRDPFDAWQNLNGGAEYLKILIERYDGNLRLALAAYNAGEGRVDVYNGVPPFHETVQYVSRVLNLYQNYQVDG